MGYIRHNAIVVTTWDEKRMGAAVDKAHEIGLSFIGPSADVVNGYRTMMVIPDGSKEGWDESEYGDTRRQAFRDWLDTYIHGDGSSPFEWVEIAYGHDDHSAEVVDSHWERNPVIADPEASTP